MERAERIGTDRSVHRPGLTALLKRLEDFLFDEWLAADRLICLLIGAGMRVGIVGGIFVWGVYEGASRTRCEQLERGVKLKGDGCGTDIIGQLFETYWLVEYDNKFYIIDQHAAREKVLYERFMKEFETREVTTQMVSPPQVISLNLQEDMLRYFEGDSCP